MVVSYIAALLYACCAQNGIERVSDGTVDLRFCHEAASFDPPWVGSTNRNVSQQE